MNLLFTRLNGFGPANPVFAFTTSFLTTLTALPVHAADSDRTAGSNSAQELEEVVVYGRSLTQIGDALAASEGSVGGADLAVRPLLKVAELLEVVPGMVAVQHSGSGKANQYFMRGFNLDHGTDFSNYIDGVPINLRSHGHGQGYLDVNGLIPETVDRIDYRKGPYRADSGDFSLSGASYMSTIDALDSPFVSIDTGRYGWLRLASGGSLTAGDGTFTGIAQYKQYDGPWEQPEELEHVSLWGKYNVATNWGESSTTLSVYRASWKPTEQIPESVIGTALCEDVFCALDDSAIGKTRRIIVNTELEAPSWKGSAYLQYYDWELTSNATYAQQIKQLDERWVAGSTLYSVWSINDNVHIAAGMELRSDIIRHVAVDFYERGILTAENGRNAINQHSLGAYAEAVWKPSSSLRLTSGLRADYYYFDVTAKNSLSSEGTESDSIVSPKLGIAYRINDSVEAYSNWGRGFHSNDARGVVNKVDPVEGLKSGTGYETGLRYEQRGINLTVTLWWLKLDSELVFVGDENTVEPVGGSRRQGVEIVGFWQPNSWLALDAVYAKSKARFNNLQDDGGTYIDGAIEDSAHIGLTAYHGSLELALRLRYLGEYALNPANTERADASTTVNFRSAYHWDNGLTVYSELLNVLDDDGKDIVYFYETNVPGASVAEGKVSRAKAPRSLRVGLTYNFN